MHENSNRRIIVIDDQESIHKDFDSILAAGSNDTSVSDAAASFLGESMPSDTGVEFELTHACQGQEGYEKVKAAVEAKKPFAMAFVDMRMPPGWDGVETIKHLWEVDPLLQVVICTAYSDQSWDEMIETLGQTDRLLILKKPFDNVEISQMACSLTEKWMLAYAARDRLDEVENMAATNVADLAVANDEIRKKEFTQKQMQGELAVARRMEAVGQLADGITHEINTPMRQISDSTRFISDCFRDLIRAIDLYDRACHSPGSAQDNFEKIRCQIDDLGLDFLQTELPDVIEKTVNAIDRISDMTHAMKMFAPRGDKETKELYDLNKAITNTATICRRQWKYIAEMELDLEEDLPPVFCNTGEFKQVLLNLIINAADAIAEKIGEDTDGRGQIKIVTRLVGQHVEIKVIDNGTGMSSSVCGQCFKADFTTKSEHKGMGSGLAIDREVIVDKHGGRMTVESEEGQGTTMIICLPLSDDEDQENIEIEVSDAA